MKRKITAILSKGLLIFKNVNL